MESKLIYKLKQELIKELGCFLEKEEFENVKCSVLEKERTGSAIPPFQTKGASNDELLYLRITPENQLKQTSAILLKSVYTIDNVFDEFILTTPEFCIENVVEFKKNMYEKVLSGFSAYFN